jgi:hypothetical protein
MELNTIKEDFYNEKLLGRLQRHVYRTAMGMAEEALEGLYRPVYS